MNIMEVFKSIFTLIGSNSNVSCRWFIVLLSVKLTQIDQGHLLTHSNPCFGFQNYLEKLVL